MRPAIPILASLALAGVLGACFTPQATIDPCSGFRRIETHQDTLIQGSNRYNAYLDLPADHPDAAVENPKRQAAWLALRGQKVDIFSVETARQTVAHNRAVKEFCGR